MQISVANSVTIPYKQCPVESLMFLMVFFIPYSKYWDTASN